MRFERKYPLCYNVPYGDEPSSLGYCERKNPSKTVHFEEVYKYIATDGKYIYTLGEKKHSDEFAKLGVDEPKLKLSNFDGCPHWYGIIYMPNGDNYELQCKITKQYLDEAHQMRGDWGGYKEGDVTSRFLSKQSIISAFNLLKGIVVQFNKICINQ